VIPTPTTRADFDACEHIVETLGAREALLAASGRTDAEGFLLQTLATLTLGRRLRALREICRAAHASGVNDPSVVAMCATSALLSFPRRRRAAERELREIVARDPELPLPRLLLARVLLTRRRTAKEAAVECRRVLEGRPRSCMGLSYLAAALRWSGQPRDALDVLADTGCRPSYLALQVKMLAQFSLHERAAGLETYRARNRLLGLRDLTSIVTLWTAFGRVGWLIVSAIGGIGALMTNGWLTAAGTVGMLAFAPVSYHVTRLWRPAVIVILGVVAYWLIYFL
jgi:hypothetical protein